MTAHWFVRTVAEGDTHRARTEHWTRDGRAHIRPLCDPTALFTALNRQPIALPYYDNQSCSTCLTTEPARLHLIHAGRRHLAAVR
ncbi:hypothetical protein [Actinoalloteichus hymeniacidonis]|uniref:Uncharacterized protein n=1 Tax=Actinoalloteichus hymeniacidonis TaxID=340345 RepID=A0AAC9HRN0_9PSEU|nr:hypothetical protein [Actinoalloteichus hymeniacidonis]AOS64089.1 hypothetical protein TL08_16445 [Actinoalloteichus hymeniacidonis]MBB5907848.1 hypothetical protein [Actinoalloteichus hymeniacidonis]